MNKCAICGGKILGTDYNNVLFLFHSDKTGADYYGCEKCAEQFSQLMESGNIKASKAAINYFHNYLDRIDNSEVKEYISEIIQNNADVVGGSSQNEKKKPINNQQEAFSHKKIARENPVTGWATMLRASAWIIIIACIISGLIAGVLTFSFSAGLGILIIGLSIIVPFLSVGTLMVFLDVAEDIKAIRLKLESKNKKP